MAVLLLLESSLQSAARKWDCNKREMREGEKKGERERKRERERDREKERERRERKE